MLIEVAVLQRFVLLLGHPVFALTVTLFSLLLGTGLGAALSRRLAGPHLKRSTAATIAGIAIIGVACVAGVTPLVNWAIPSRAPSRIAIAVRGARPDWNGPGCADAGRHSAAAARAPQMLTWAWGMNGALSVVGATLAHLHRHELGIQITAAGGLGHIPDRVLRIACSPPSGDGGLQASVP